MARTWDEDINKHQDWGGDESTQGLSVSGTKVQKFIKDTLQSKIGYVYSDRENSRCLAFADREDYELYRNDPSTYGGLVIQSWYSYFPDSPGPGPDPGPTPTILEHTAYYGSTVGQITPTNASSQIYLLDSTFMQNNICRSNNPYVYIIMDVDYELTKALTINNEDLLGDFVNVGTFVMDGINYKIFEFHMSSGLSLDVDINITIRQ